MSKTSSKETQIHKHIDKETQTPTNTHLTNLGRFFLESFFITTKSQKRIGISVRDFISRLKHPSSRCAMHEHISNNQLLDRSIHSLKHIEIYNRLVTRDISNLDDVTTNAIQLGDNLMIRGSKILS